MQVLHNFHREILHLLANFGGKNVQHLEHFQINLYLEIRVHLNILL